MLLKFFGHSCVLIDNQILIDPHDGGSIGLPRPNIKAVDLILITHDHYDHNAYQLFEHKDLKMNFYGSFEYKEYNIRGIKTYHDKQNGKLRGENSVYIIEKDKKKIVHLGDLGHMPNEKLYNDIYKADVLLIPIGGVITINYKEAAEIVKMTLPKIVVPLHYWTYGHYMPLDPPDNFITSINYEVRYLDTKNNEINEEENKSGIIYIFKV